MLKSPLYQRWVIPNRNPLLLIVGLLIVYLCITLFYTPKKVDPIYFSILVNRKYHIVEGGRGGDFLSLKYNYLFDPEKYREHFFLSLDYPKDDTETMKTLLKEVKKGDTLIVGVDKNEFMDIQNYSSNFIKDDFFNRSLRTYYLYKNRRALIFTKQSTINNETKGILNALLLITCFTIAYIVVKNTNWYKNFT